MDGSSPRGPRRHPGAWLLLALSVSCSSNVTPTSSATPPSPPGTAPSPFVLALASDAGGESSVVYVSLPPDSIPNSTSATIENTHNDAVVTVRAINGGFDPVAIPGRVGDTLDITVQLPAGPVSFVVVAPKPRPPRVVRTDPPANKRDVPLNASLAVVFSEPIDPASLSGSTVNVSLGNVAVTGTLTFSGDDHTAAVFVPDQPLAPNTTYQLTVTSGISATDGSTLDAPVTASFTTGTTFGAAPASMILTPGVDTLLFLGPTVPLTAIFRDANGQPAQGLLPVHWSSSAPNVVEVPKSTLVPTTVLGTPGDVAIPVPPWFSYGDTGTAVISASAGDNFTATARITVRYAPGTQLVLSAGTLPLISIGGPLPITADVWVPAQSGAAGPATETELTGRSLSWSSSDEGVATVDTVGTVIGIAPGTATITGTYRGFAGTVGVTVVPPPQGAGRFVAIDPPASLAAGAGIPVSLSDGSVLVTDGHAAEILDPSTHAFSRIANPVHPGAFGGTIATLSDGRVLFVNGRVAELFNPASRTFAATGAPIPIGITDTVLNAVTLASGKVLMLYGRFTGDCSSGCPVSRAQLYDPASGTFARAGAYAANWDTTSWGFTAYGATRLASGSVLINGYPRAQLYDPSTDSFSVFGAPYDLEFSPDAALLLPDGKVLFIGSNDRDGDTPGGAELFDPVAGQFVAISQMRLSRYHSTATVLKNGLVLVVGGEAPTCNGCPWSSTAQSELYDPSTRTFSLSAMALSPRSRHGAAPLGDGSVLVIGGSVFTHIPGGYTIQPNTTAELYIPDAPSQARRSIVTKGAH